MFTGIVEQIGAVTAIDRYRDSVRLTITGPLVVSDAKPGDSISVSGCCLTITEFDATGFSADVMAETLSTTALAELAVGDQVNLERAVAVCDRLGGHIVQGHVDATGVLTDRQRSEHWEVLTFQFPSELSRYVVAKGSITVSGTSLTVVDVSDVAEPQAWFSVSLIPTTLNETVLGALKPGDRVNVEVDVLAKYVERMVAQ